MSGCSGNANLPIGGVRSAIQENGVPRFAFQNYDCRMSFQPRHFRYRMRCGLRSEDAWGLSEMIASNPRASRLAKQLDSARLDNKLRDIRELASLSYIDASKMNYGSAAEASERMFGLVREVADDTKDDSLRRSLNGCQHSAIR